METESTNTNEVAASTASSQETTESQISEATPAQETSTTEATSQATPPKEETWEYNGDRTKVPDNFKKYATGFDRYISTKDQALAEANKRIQEYESKLKSVGNNKETPSEASKPEPLVTQDEIDAISMGDGKTLESVIQRAVDKRLEATVTPIVQQQRQLEAAQTIESFKAVHPDFQELLDSPAGEFMISAASRGASLEQIYKTASEAKAYFQQKGDEQRKADLEAKKAGSTVGRSIAGSPDVVYAETEDQAKRLAIEMTLKGDKRHVRVKTKK